MFTIIVRILFRLLGGFYTWILLREKLLTNAYEFTMITLKFKVLLLCKSCRPLGGMYSGMTNAPPDFYGMADAFTAGA